MGRKMHVWGISMLIVFFLVACSGGSGSSSGSSGDSTHGGSSVASSELEDLPDDTGGTHNAFVLGDTTAAYGFYLYIPGGYQDVGPAYPLLVFLHGAGEKGNSQTPPTPSAQITVLNRVLVHGPPKLVGNGTWDPPSPMLVASPQCHDGGWNADKLHDFINYLISSYNVNEERIYLTGLSMGGGGTFNYCAAKGQDALVAAAVPICGWGNPPRADEMKHIPTWAFHGDADGTVNVNGSINMINAINDTTPPVRARLTLYPGVGHNSWARTYNGSGMGTERADYDAFNMTIYQWMLQYKRAVTD